MMRSLFNVIARSAATRQSIFFLCLSLAAPALADQKGNCGTIILPTGVGVAPSADITSMNPLLVTSLYNAQTASLMFQGLIWLDRDEQIDWSRSLASDIETPDQGQTYNVTLRPWHWSDGVPVTAADVAYTFKLIKQLGTTYAGYGAGGMPDIVKSLNIISPTQFQVVLTHRVNPTWFTYNGLSQFTPLPEHSWGKYSVDQIWQEQSSPAFFNVVDGPLKIQSLNTGLNAIMVPNPNFEGPKMHFDRLIFKFLDTQGASLQQVEAGDLDMANAPLAFWSAIQNLPGLHLVAMPPSLSYDEIALNFRNPHVAFFRDVRVRQAMADAINQAEIIKVIYHGQGAEAHGPAPTTPPTFLSPDMRAGHYPVSFDPAKSRALLQAAGFTPGPDGVMQKNGQRLSFVYLLPQGDATTDLVGIFEQAAMKKIGIDMKIQNIEFNQMLALLVSGGTGWEAAGLGETLGGYPSGEYLFKTGSAENSGGYSDKMIDTLIDRSTNEPGLQGLFDYEDYASAQQPVIFEQHTAQPILANDRIHGVENFVDPAGNYYPEQLYCATNNTVAIK